MKTIALISVVFVGLVAANSVPSNPRLYSRDDIANLAMFSEHLQRQNEINILDGETSVRIGRCKYAVKTTSTFW